MILVQLYELFTSDPPESLGVRGQTAKAVMHGRNGRDALSDRSVDEQFARAPLILLWSPHLI